MYIVFSKNPIKVTPVLIENKIGFPEKVITIKNLRPNSFMNSGKQLSSIFELLIFQ
jgi:hypothetical protein